MIQITLPTIDPAPALGLRTSVRPNGHRQNSAIRAEAIPNGIVMIKHAHDERGERIAERDPEPAEHEPDEVQQQPHDRRP